MDGKEMQNAQNARNAQVNREEVNREGFAMVTTLLVVLILSVLAVGAVWMATSEKKTSFAEGVHVASVFAADAGGEAGINYIRLSDTPPDFHTQATTALEGAQSYEYDTAFLAMRLKPGWDIDLYRDFDYEIDALGQASRNGESGVKLVVSRLYRIRY
jgi:hypothetical protein